MEALRLVAGRADLLHTDAMRRTFLLFDTGAAESCAEIGCMEARRGPDVSTDGSATAWTPWRAPSDRERLLADVPGGTDLIRHFATVYHGDGEPLEQVRAFPVRRRSVRWTHVLGRLRPVGACARRLRTPRWRLARGYATPGADGCGLGDLGRGHRTLTGVDRGAGRGRLQHRCERAKMGDPAFQRRVPARGGRRQLA